jgi:uncharacterized membrane protein
MKDASTRGLTGRWYRPSSVWRSIRQHPRLYMATIAGVATVLLLPHSLPASVREALGWIIAGVVYLGFACWLMVRSGPETIAARSARNDDSRIVILGLILLAVASSFVSIAGLMTEAKEASRQVRLAYVMLSAATIVVSWFVMQVVFSLHYAHEFYRPSNTGDGARGGLTFPGEEQPDYWDFLYFATSIGATSQTSDVSIRSRVIRRLATVHAVVSFFFNSAVLALTINLAASLI